MPILNTYFFSLQLPRMINIATCLALLTGCTVGPDFSELKKELQNGELMSKLKTQEIVSPSATTNLAKWWLNFDDPVLIDLENRVQQTNLDLQIATSRIEQSRALLGITKSSLQPSIAANGSYSRNKLSENGQFAALGAPTNASNFWQASVDASWELDLWGRAHRSSEGATAALEATEYDKEALRVAVSAELARNYLLLRGVQTQLDNILQNQVIAERSLKLAESRERNGIATRFESSSARAQLASVNAMIPELIQHRNTLMNSLALLLGDEPQALNEELLPNMPLPSLPSNIPSSIPSEFAHRRPDILRAEAQLHAATASVGVAMADFYPRIGLKGRVGVEAFESQDLSSWDSRFFSIGPTVYLPIFQGGRLKQRLALNEERQKNAALTYRQTVLKAWHEVDNALDATVAQQSIHKELMIAYEQNKQALQIAELGYQEGASDYLSVLTAQRNLLASQTNLNNSSTNGALTLVNLYKALGGGWN